MVREGGERQWSETSNFITTDRVLGLEPPILPTFLFCLKLKRYYFYKSEMKANIAAEKKGKSLELRKAKREITIVALLWSLSIFCAFLSLSRALSFSFFLYFASSHFLSALSQPIALSTLFLLLPLCYPSSPSLTISFYATKL